MFQTVNFCIPPLRTKIQLAQDWEFRLFHERRNHKLLQTLDLIDKDSSRWHMYTQTDKFKNVTVSAGSVLNVARIYIRQGSGFSEFDSVTFTCKKKEGQTKDGKPFHGRFWAKLSDVNKIICYPIGDVKMQGFFNVAELKEQPDRFDFL